MNSVAFGPFSFSHDDLELRRDGSPVPLQRQPALVLSCLLRHPGRVVSRHELARHVWPAGHHVEVDQSLRYCVRQVRIALDDDAGSPRYVETLPKKGFRWVAVAHPPRAAATGQTTNASQPPPNRMGWMKAWGLSAAALCVGLLVGRQLPVPVGSPLHVPIAGAERTDLRAVIDALHVLAHAAVEPGLDAQAAEAMETLREAAAGYAGLTVGR
jgi:DNA-binding winged helix-turn-helix (wHTH) protein